MDAPRDVPQFIPAAPGHVLGFPLKAESAAKPAPAPQRAVPTDAVPTFSALSQDRDGIRAMDLGRIGDCQYALDVPMFASGQPVIGNVWRRPADQMGTYGGWRWECFGGHPAQCTASSGAKAAQPFYRELAERIATAIEHVRSALAAPCGRCGENDHSTADCDYPACEQCGHVVTDRESIAYAPLCERCGRARGEAR